MSDIERERIEKARAVGAAIKEGRLPTTDQAVTALNNLSESGALQKASEGMSLEGKKVVLDTLQLVDDTRKTLQAKFPNNELQSTIAYTGMALNEASPVAQKGTAAAKGAAKRAGEEIADTAQNVGQTLHEATEKAVKLTKLVVTNSEFRTLLKDVTNLLQDVLRNNVEEASAEFEENDELPDSVRNAAKKLKQATTEGDMVNKAKEKGSEVVEAAKEKGSKAAKSAEKDVESAKETTKKGAGKAADKAKEVGGKSKDSVEDVANKTREAASRRSLRNTTKAAVDAVADTAEEHLPKDTVEKVSSTIRSGAKGDLSLDETVEQAKKKAKTVANQGTKELKEKAGKAKEVMSDVMETGGKACTKLVDLPEDKKKEIISKFKKISETIQTNPEFKSAIDDILALLAQVRDRTSGVADMIVDEVEEVTDETKDAAEDVKGHVAKKARVAAQSSKQLIESFAGGRSLDSLIASVTELAQETANDDQLQDFLSSFFDFAAQAFTSPEYITAPDFSTTASTILSGLRDVYSRYTTPALKFMWEASWYSRALASDTTISKLSHDANALFADLFLDEKGNPAFKPQLLMDLAKCIPAIAEKLAYLPIPRIETDDGTYQFILDNIVLHSTILPKYVHILTDTTLDATSESAESSVELEISHVEASARDVAWLYNKHAGFFRAGDVGFADFDIKNEGLSIRLVLVPGAQAGVMAGTNDITRGRIFQVESAKVEVKDLDLRLHDSSHDWLYAIARPLITARAKQAIEDAIESGLRSALFRLDTEIAHMTGKIGATDGVLPIPQKEIPAEWGSSAFNA